MCPYEWLRRRGKEPLVDVGGACFWECESVFSFMPETFHTYTLPSAIFARLGRQYATAANVRAYITRELAITNFYWAYIEAVKNGWDPEGKITPAQRS